MKRVAVFGLALTGTAAARALVLRNFTTVLSDDVITSEHRKLAAELSCDIVPVDSSTAISNFLEGIDVLIPAPGVAPHHPVIATALSKGISVRTEIDIAFEWEQQRPGGSRPILGVTGTDGKTTTTMIAAALVRSTGRTIGEVGNTNTPFMAALDDPFDAFVVECSSFRLQFTDFFRCDASVWLNIAPDHLDWHGTMEQYTGAKRRLWSYVQPTDVVIAPFGNSTILEMARESGARVVTFGLSEADYRLESNSLVGPGGVISSVDTLWRSLPHDITNSLAAAALVVESGLCSVDKLTGPLQAFQAGHHRIEFVGSFAGANWYDDSKATSPHAALAAIRSFDRIVLIAGGRNKNLDLTQLATEPSRIAGVIAIGEDAEVIARAFSGKCPVRVAESMSEAVKGAASLVQEGETVLLSPGCTSYDWYKNYNERGDDFQSKVREFFSRSDRRV